MTGASAVRDSSVIGLYSISGRRGRTLSTGALKESSRLEIVRTPNGETISRPPRRRGPGPVLPEASGVGLVLLVLLELRLDPDDDVGPAVLEEGFVGGPGRAGLAG